jgi:hypothetical protein
MNEKEVSAIVGGKKGWMGLRAIFLSINLAILTFFVGLIVGKAWYLEMQYSYKQTILTLDKGDPMVGRIMHPGDKAILFYKMKDVNDQSSGIRLVARERIKEIQLCKTECTIEPRGTIEVKSLSYGATRILVGEQLRQRPLSGHIRPAMRPAASSSAGL